MDPRDDREWADRWAPYDEGTYQDALDLLKPDDVVLDIGSGDLRFSRLATRRTQLVAAIDKDVVVLFKGVAEDPLPENLLPVAADARTWPFRARFTVGILLMRHCPPEDFALYACKLRECGCTRLVTNARWGLGVEEVALAGGGQYGTLVMGWYACTICGRTGFIEGDPMMLTPEIEAAVMDVEGCPDCRYDSGLHA